VDIKFVEKDQNWQEETTVYWFEVGAETYAISDNYGILSMLDCDGCPINETDDRNAPIFSEMLNRYESHIDA